MQTMTSSLARLLMLVVLLSLESGLAWSAPASLKVGKTLSADQIAQISGRELLVNGKPIMIVSHPNSSRLKQVAETAASSFVINDRGQVGRSLHDIVIARVTAEQVKLALTTLNLAPASIRHYGHLNNSILRFATFEQAVAAQTQLRLVLPQALVALPIEYHRRNLR